GVLANDRDVDGDALAAVLVSGPNHASADTGGLFTLHSDGSFTYRGDTNYNGTDSFTYKANDGHLNSNVATVTITVNAVNDAVQIKTTGAGALAANPNTIKENESTILRGSFADPDVGDSHTVTINWGDGSPNDTLTVDPGVDSFSAIHPYLDDP